MRRLAPLGALVLAVAACGSGQSPVVEGDAGRATTSTTAVVAAGDTHAPTGGDAANGDGVEAGGTNPGGPTASDDDHGNADPGATGADGGSTDPFAPPAAGTYTFHTTGTGPPESLVGPPRSIDEQTVTTVTALDPDTVRQTTTASGGTQTTDLRYEASRVALLLLEISFGGEVIRFPSAEGVTFVPLPPTAGQSWHGVLTDESGQLTATVDGTTQPVEAIEVMGRTVDAFVIDATITITGSYGGVPVDATVQVRAWLDPALRTSARIHQVTTIRQPVVSSSDTTSELVGFAPA